MLQLRRLRGALLRRSKYPAAAAALAGSGATATAASEEHRKPPAFQRPTLRIRCLLLHAAGVALLLWHIAADILERQERSARLARQLLAGGGDFSAAAAGAPGGAESRKLEQCAEALQLPQVALLFLVQGTIHHEAFWRLWFQTAASLLPADAVAAALCGSRDSGGGWQHAVEACGGGGGGRVVANRQQGQGGKSSMGGGDLELMPAAGVLDRQTLFDVYVHPQPSFSGYPTGSPFRGRELPPEERVTARWGQHSLVDATKALLRAARRNPRNTKFVLLSEADLPLYHPHLLYDQLVHERLSRVNACNTTPGWHMHPHRWVERMAGKRLRRHHWRKSWQWFALTAAHADLVLADAEVDAAFRAHCATMFEPARGEERECYSDEHYVPTVLALAGRDNETDCQGQLTDVDWARVPPRTPHPYEYSPGELSDALLLHLRRPRLPGCGNAARAAATAATAFVPAADLAAGLGSAGTGGAAAAEHSTGAMAEVCQQLEQRISSHQQQHVPLGSRCRLLARKFLNSTAAAALAAAAPCDSAALVLNGGVCAGESPQQAARRRAWQRAAPLVLLAAGGLLLAPLLTALLLGLAAGREGRRRGRH